MNQNSAVVAAAAIGGAAALAGTIMLEPLRAWAARRAVERATVVRILGRVGQVNRLAGDMGRARAARAAEQDVFGVWRAMDLAEDDLVHDVLSLSVTAAKRTAERATFVQTACQVITEAARAGQTVTDAMLSDQGSAEWQLVRAVRPWWRRAPRAMANLEWQPPA